MVYFFQHSSSRFYLAESHINLESIDLEKLTWLFGNAKNIKQDQLEGKFIGPRKEMITPWSTNAIEITKNMVWKCNNATKTRTIEG